MLLLEPRFDPKTVWFRPSPPVFVRFGRFVLRFVRFPGQVSAFSGARTATSVYVPHVTAGILHLQP